MKKEEIALQLTLKSLEKFRLEKASQVAEIYNIIYETLRYPADEDEQPAGQAEKQSSERRDKKSAEPPGPQSSTSQEKRATGERKEPSTKKATKTAKGEQPENVQESMNSEELTHKLGEALKRSEEQAGAS